MAMAQGQVVVKNTFIEVVEDSSPMAEAPPTKSAPGYLQEKSFRTIPSYVHPVAAAPMPQPAAHPNVFKRIFGSRHAAQQEAAAAVQQKNTFVHFDEPKSPTAPPTNSAPGNTVFLGSSSGPPPQVLYAATPTANLTDGNVAKFPSSVMRGNSSGYITSVPSMPSVSENTQIILTKDTATLDRMDAAAGDQVALGEVAAVVKSGLASLGSEGHASGQCIPCLMQVRWQAGKCAEPCRFGALCGRCHEPHTEEELQRIQAKMRKLKKKGGAAGAALLSAAYARGTAAPVGKGAGKGLGPPQAAAA